MSKFQFFKLEETEGVEVCEEGYSLYASTYVEALEETLRQFGVVVKKVDDTDGTD